MLDQEEKLRFLKKSDFFAFVAESDLLKFLEHLQETTVESGESLFIDGEPGTDMFVLLKGRMQISKGKRVIRIVEPPDCIGEMALIEEAPRSADALATEPSTLLKIPRTICDRYLFQRPEVVFAMMRALSQRLRADTETVTRDFETVNMLVHDMRNKLMVFSFLEMMEEKNLSDADREALQFMRDVRDELVGMTSEALATAKRQRHNAVMRRGSLATLLRTISKTDAGTHPDLRDRRLELRLANKIPDLTFCAPDIRRVVSNLLVNAAQASPSETPILLEATHNGDEVTVCVRDHGSGIPEHIQRNIFTTYFTTKEHGNGLGLASSKQIIEEEHRGRLFFESTPGQGTVFTFILPLDLEERNSYS